MNTPLIRIHRVHKSYLTGGGETLNVLRGVDLEIAEGTIAAIIGASGAGKSTLLHIMGALDRPTRGSVHIGDEEIFSLDDRALAAFRNRRLGFVFQFHHLLPEFSAVENVAMPALIAGEGNAAAFRKARDLLAEVRVEERADARPSQLSGGEQQRVAVARALMNDPQVVLADEPSGNLDEENARMLHDLLWNLARERRQTFVIVTHDRELARSADRTYRLHEGVVLEEHPVT